MATGTVDQANGKLVITELPAMFEDYERWRFRLKAAVLAVAPDPVSAMPYLAEIEIDTTPFDDLALNVPADLVKLDVSLFGAVVHACRSRENQRYLDQIQSMARFGSGRQAVKLLDVAHRSFGEGIKARASAQIHELKCGSMKELTQYLARFRVYMGKSEDARRCRILSRPTFFDVRSGT